MDAAVHWRLLSVVQLLGAEREAKGRCTDPGSSEQQVLLPPVPLLPGGCSHAQRLLGCTQAAAFSPSCLQTEAPAGDEQGGEEGAVGVQRDDW